jgi:serine/threonine protein phosphatase PrpC
VTIPVDSRQSRLFSVCTPHPAHRFSALRLGTPLALIQRVKEAQMKLEYAARSIAGKRDANQDAVLAFAPSAKKRTKWGLFAVADGMGGYAGGELASALTIGALAEVYQGNKQLGDCREAIALAHRRVRERKLGPVAQMGSTVALLHLRQSSPRGAITATIAHVGDSRVYRLRDGRLEQLTRDHSLYTSFCQAAGAEEALPAYRDFQYKNVITRAIGMPDSQPDVSASEAQPGDLFLLCSDGLVEGLSEPAIEALVQQQRDLVISKAGQDRDLVSLDEICEALVDGAENGGSRDNISVVLARVISS